MKIRSGNIPKELTYFVAAPQEITISWEDVELEEGESEKVEKIQPTFVSDSSNPKTLATGKTWAINASRIYDRATNSHISKPSKEITRTNDPITSLRVFGLDHRGRGGRAWKCGDDDGHYFDLREDVLLDLMRTVGISKGGYLNGEYIWAKIHAEMKLVRVGSDLHAALTTATERREMDIISKKDLKPWHLYQQKNGEVFLYAGEVSGFKNKTRLLANTPEDLRRRDWLDAKVAMPGSWSAKTYFDKYKNMDEPPKPAKMKIDYTHYIAPLWLSIKDWNDSKTIAENLKSLESIKDSLISNSYGLHIASFDTKKVVRELQKFEIPSLFEQIRLKALEQVVKRAPERRGYDRLLLERDRLVFVASCLIYGTIYPAGGEMDPSYDFWITEIISKEP